MKIPFQHLTARAWQNLALAGLTVFYLIQFALPVAQGSTLSGLGSDYRAFWAAGYIANHWGYAEIYNLERLTEVQQPLTPEVDEAHFSPVPAPYFPVFLIPLQALALLPAQMSFWVWELLNLVGLTGYLVFFARRLRPGAPVGRLLALSLLFMPVFSNFWWGQPGLWLVICTGEFYWNLREEKSFSAGLWLGGWLFKPQLLMLILPALALQKQWKTLAGVTLTGALVGGASLTLLGGAGLENFLHLLGFWGAASSNLPAINPYLMINWRMLALYLTELGDPILGWSLFAVGTTLTSLAALSAWHKPLKWSQNEAELALFGLLAATSAVAWHSHQHTLMIVLPLFWARLLQGEFSGWALGAWLYLLPLSFGATFAAGLAMRLGWLPAVDAVGGLITGGSGLTLSLLLLGWSLWPGSSGPLRPG